MTNLQHSAIKIPVWEYAYSGPACTGKIKTIPDDFIVEEQLPFHPDGSGEHVFLQIEKCGENTEYVARLLARFAGVRQRDVSVAGLKDRHARTTQWFSVWLPGKDAPDWQQIETKSIKVVQSLRHARKLKRGVLSGNRFEIIIRELQGDKTRLDEQLQQINIAGFPNYFGVQRFGHQGQNVDKAMSLFQGAKVKREQRSIYLSAARSYLFNQLLAKRVIASNWNQAVSGDVCIFDQSNSYFKSTELDASVLQRIKRGEIHPAGLLFGKGERETSALALEFEDSIIDLNTELVDGLIKYDLKSDRRSLRIMVRDLRWDFKSDSELLLKFSLPAGSYATSLIRELIEIE